MKWKALSLITFFLLILDIITKSLTHFFLPKMSWLILDYPYGGIGIFHFGKITLSLNHVENTGAAWGIFSNYSILLFFLRILIVIFLIVYLLNKQLSFVRSLPYCLIITGAIGNILDYIFYGHVIDMIHFKFFSYSFPVFNLADSMISIGIIWLMIDAYLFHKNKPSAPHEDRNIGNR